MDESNIFLSVVIPAFNEEKRIPETLRLMDDYLRHRGKTFEMIIVDDGSSDRTVEVVRKFISGKDYVKLYENGVNRGKGYSVKRGVLQARGDYVLFSDADLATPIEELEKLLIWIESDYDVAIGSRRMKDSNVIVPATFFRRLVGKAGYFFIWFIVLRYDIVDTQCGFKCFKRGAAINTFSRQKLDGGMFDVEIIHIALKRGLRVKEVPVAWRHKAGSTINILKCMLFDPIDLFKIRLNSLLGVYN